MANSAQKYVFLQRAQNIANMMASLDAAISDAGRVLVDRGWQAGGADPITATDIPTDAGFDVAAALAFFTVAGKFNTFMSGGAVSADATARAAVDKMRSNFNL